MTLTYQNSEGMKENKADTFRPKFLLTDLRPHHKLQPLLCDSWPLTSQSFTSYNFDNTSNYRPSLTVRREMPKTQYFVLGVLNLVSVTCM